MNMAFGNLPASSINQRLRAVLDGGYNYWTVRPLSVYTSRATLRERINARLRMKHAGISPGMQRLGKEKEARRALLLAKSILDEAGRNDIGSNRSGLSGADETAATELELYIDNDADLYRQQGQPILRNLANKAAQGKYNHVKAVKLYMYLMDNGAKKYAREFAHQPSEWNQIFSAPTRKMAAEKFARSFETEY